jgi:hypothetical protein
MYDISKETLEAQALRQFGPEAKIGEPYMVDDQCIRVGIYWASSEVSYGINYFYKEGVFR